MKNKSFRRRGKRFLSGFMAVLCFCVAVFSSFELTSMVSHAGTFRGTNIWSGGSETILGHERNYLYRWTDGYQMTFCISPGKHMGNTVTAGALRTNIDDADIPYISSREDYEKLAVICTWFDQNGANQASNATYAAVQAAVWAIVTDGWESADALVRKVDKHISGTYARWTELKAYVEGDSQGGMPAWLQASGDQARQNPQGMQLIDGVWMIEFDVSEEPQLAALNWQFESTSQGWSKQVSNGKLIFQYSGGQLEGNVVSAALPASLARWARNTTSLVFYIPAGDPDAIQAMICAGLYEPKVYLGLSAGGAMPEESELEVKIYKHRETFLAHYQVELDKLCAETGQTLEGAAFRVLEAVAGDQTGGMITPGNMTPKPAAWQDFKVCAEAITDGLGHIIHRDTKKYEYVKTYCDGHPLPAGIQAPGSDGGEEDMYFGLDDPNEDGAGGAGDAGGIGDSGNAGNAALLAQWEALVAACEEETDFHGMEAGEGLRMMLEDRQETYERFINLKYDYTFEETRAKYGYVHHGQHNDDIPIPVVRISSSEAGGGYEIVDRDVVVNESVGSGSSSLSFNVGKLLDLGMDSNRNLISERLKKGVELSTIGSQDQRLVKTRIRKTDIEKTDAVKTATPGDAETATASDARKEEALYHYYLESHILPVDEEPGGDSDQFAGTFFLPEPEPDDIPWIDPSGDDSTTSYQFQVEDHRTEGELHINKQDIELWNGQTHNYNSYGDTQGDATLEGAVYGLYAAEDIIHPDGKTGVIYAAGELTAIAATDKNGDASFLAYTEESDTSRAARNLEGTWIGHPLLAGRYVIQEIARSEGYELMYPSMEKGISGDMDLWSGAIGRASVVSAMRHPIDMHDGSWLEFEVTYEDTALGFDILAGGFPEGTLFFRSNMQETASENRVVIGSQLVETGEYERAEAGEYRLDENGNYVPRRDSNGNILYDTDNPVTKTYYAVRRLSDYPTGEASPSVDLEKWQDTSEADTDYVTEEVNAMLEQLGYRSLNRTSGAPWTMLELNGTSNQEIAEEILEWFSSHSFWDSGSVYEITEESGRYQAVILHDYAKQQGNAIYEALTDTLYVRMPITAEGVGKAHVFVPYRRSEIVSANGYVTTAAFRQEVDEIPFGEKIEDYLTLAYQPLYEQYREGEYRLDGNGNRIPIYQWEYIYETRSETTSDYELQSLDAVYDPSVRGYIIHVDNHVDWNQMEGPVTETFRAAASETSIYVDGKEMFYSDYLADITGVGASAFASADIERVNHLYLAELIYPGQISPSQDGSGTPGYGTRKSPVSVQEQIIRQKIQVIKDVDGNGYTDVDRLSNFRFKAYLKNNLTRLFRDEAGTVVWLDRKGNEIDVLRANDVYPELVPDIFTKVLHKTDPLYKRSSDAVTANERLYEIDSDQANSGYTAILEKIGMAVEDGTGSRVISTYNYDKFFDAIEVANRDKWDDAAPTYTSYRPLGNEINQSEAARESALISDMVRQFAIDWYLDNEVDKLTWEKDVSGYRERVSDDTAYGDQLYDEALHQAIIKAENYLVPFFSYDLDEIYAIEWDSEGNGGFDYDKTTISADEESTAGFYGLSVSLPYGTYVIVEQQPHYAALWDYQNRHYRIDGPKEITVPMMYAEADGSRDLTDTPDAEYIYDTDMLLDEMEERFLIRFGEESDVISAHNHSGDFEIYKYGLDIDLVRNGDSQAGKGDYFALTQDKWKPFQNYYNSLDDRISGKVSYYLSEGMSGRNAISEIYRYSSISENASLADDVGFPGGEVTEKNPDGIQYRNGVEAMTGVQTAYDGLYSAVLVPSSPKNSKSDDLHARVRFHNTYFEARLRIEKMDSKTHENLLHDGAIFNIYAASRDESLDGEGQVLFYEEDTLVTGSRRFLESMGAMNIEPIVQNNLIKTAGKVLNDLKEYLSQISLVQWFAGIIRQIFSADAAGDEMNAESDAAMVDDIDVDFVICSGVIPAGTPICHEEDQILQVDLNGIKTGNFKSFTTTRDGLMESINGDKTLLYGEQNAGYLQTPEPLGAGVYVLVEVRPPAGYVRSAPIAIEVYSDTISYYKGAGHDNRVIATLYDTTRGDLPKSQNREDTARIYVENEPTTLVVEKLKESVLQDTVTYKVSGRVDGSLVQIGSNPNYEYAYQNGVYMGYGWKKGTLEYLKARQDAGEQVEIIYHSGLFAGYGYVTQPLNKADDKNPYIPGALMTLYEGIELVPSGDMEDQAFEGLTVERSAPGNVSRMYVREGYAGFHTEFIEVQDGEDRYWSAATVKRPDTDILYYDLGNLELFDTEIVDGIQVQYAFNRNHEKMAISQIEEDKRLVQRTDGGHSIFAFQGGMAVLELVDGDFTQISYSSIDKVLDGKFARPIIQGGKVIMSEGVTVYHLDSDGNRDSFVDPYTGMAYAIVGRSAWSEEDESDSSIRVIVWPVHVAYDQNNRILSKDKISTSRVAAIGDSQENNYLTGTWRSQDREDSHELSTLRTNNAGQNMNGEPLLASNNGSFEKTMSPVYDEHGMVQYYQQSDETYEQGTDLYDRSQSLVREKRSDLLDDYDQASYTIQGQSSLRNGTEDVYHRLGESYILENTWVTGEITPDDPFSNDITDGHADILTRVPAGIYIMEELKAPAGYLKGLPVGVVVEETTVVQRTDMVDAAVKAVINKIDGAEDYRYSVLDMTKGAQTIGTVTEGKGAYGQTQISDIRLALYEAERVYTSDLEHHPVGTYLKKKTNIPVVSWTSSEVPQYLEGIPAGEYLLEELETPDGFVSSEAIEVVISHTRDVQMYTLYNDHTKVEVEKYMEGGDTKTLVSGAGFALYEALTDIQGQIIYDENGIPQYDPGKEIDHFVSSDGQKYKGFMETFEEMYGLYGSEVKILSWNDGYQDYTARYVSHVGIDASASGGNESMFPTTSQLIFRTDDDEDIRITVYQQMENHSGRHFVYEYQFDFHSIPEVNERAVSYLTKDGIHRWDYLPTDKAYVLVETDVPAGFAEAASILIVPQDIRDIQRYRVKNEEGRLIISKTILQNGIKGEKELPGAKMALYLAGENGELIQDSAHMAAMWISGQDGVYSELERINGEIPDGYEEGDLRPHMLKRLPDGIYWLAELESPSYYTTFEPTRIEYHQEDQIRVVRVSDAPVDGTLEVKKTDAEGNILSGAVFQVSAYRQPDFKTPIFVRMFSDSDSIAILTGLPVGEVQSDGSIIPYAYRLQEIVPPEGYAINSDVISFEFAPDRNGVSYTWEESAWYQTEIVDEKTRVVIRKQELAALDENLTDDVFVDGAELCVYRVSGTDQAGNFVYDESAPVEVWMTRADDPDHVIEGLIAGQTYLLVETIVPSGYRKMNPVAFTLSEDGRAIVSISSHLAAITIHSLYSLTIHGRYAIKTQMEVTDENGYQIASWIASGDGHVLTEEDGVHDGDIYTLTERTIYSDGSYEITGRITRRISLEDGKHKVTDRCPEKVILQLKELDGARIASYSPTESTPELTVGDEASEQQLLKNRRIYILAESTIYSDGKKRESNRLAFQIDRNGSIEAISGYDSAYDIVISKMDITGSDEIPGAFLQILDGDGTIVEEWISDIEPHYVETKLSPEGPYYLHESLAPNGYAYASDIRFTVSADGSIEQVIMEDRQTRVSVTKTDITGEKEVPGARLQILDQNDTVVEEWISQNQSHEIVGKLSAGETYILHEDLAPAGYDYASDIEFTVSLDGGIDQVMMKDVKLPARSTVRVPTRRMPDEPVPTDVGDVLAQYSPVIIGTDGMPLGTLRYMRIADTGDIIWERLVLTFILLLGSMIPLTILWVKKRNRKGVNMNRYRILMILLLYGVLMNPQTTQAADKKVLSGRMLQEMTHVTSIPAETRQLVSGSASEITVTYDVLPDIGSEENDLQLPDDTYIWEDREYQLKSYQLITVTMPVIEKYVQSTVFYEGVEQAVSVPETSETEVFDEVTGRSAIVSLPVMGETYSNWRWVDGFSFPVTVRKYDTGIFQLGEALVPVREEEPFQGYEQQLLELIGVDPEYYRIDSTAWTSEPQEGENGQIYRQAIAYGQKYIADVEVLYGGSAVIPEEPGQAYQAVYRLIEPETEPSAAATPTDAMINDPEGGSGIPEPPETDETTEADSPGWIRILRNGTSIMVGLGVCLFPFLAFLKRRKERRQNMTHIPKA